MFTDGTVKNCVVEYWTSDEKSQVQFRNMSTALSLIVDHASHHVPGGIIGKWSASTIFLKPLAWLYLEGPRTFGFWGGAAMSDICSQLTNTRSQFWNSEPASLECAEIVQRHYWSYVVLASSISYVAVIVWTIKHACLLCTAKKTTRRHNLKHA